MGRPKEHDEATRRRLLDEAEALLREGGPDALSLRAVADAAETTTRAVYSLFGSKEGLLQGLAARTYELLRDAITELPVTRDPAADLVEAALRVFRQMAVTHPALYQLSYQRIVPDFALSEGAAAVANEAFSLLRARFERLAEKGLLSDREPGHAALQFHAFCEGMAAVELRGARRFHPTPEQAWRDAFSAFVNGLSVPPVKQPRPRPSARAS